MVTYEEIVEQDLPTITALYAEYLTAGQALTDGTYAAWSRGDCFGTKAVDDGRIVGFFGMRKGLELTYPHPELEAEINAFVGDRILYIVDGMLVLPGYRGMGIATRLVENTIPELRRRGAELALIEVWIYPDGRMPGKHPQDKLGEIVYSKKVPLFYRDMNRYGLRCPICGEHCVCGAWIDIARIAPE